MIPWDCAASLGCRSAPFRFLYLHFLLPARGSKTGLKPAGYIIAVMSIIYMQTMVLQLICSHCSQRIICFQKISPQSRLPAQSQKNDTKNYSIGIRWRPRLKFIVFCLLDSAATKWSKLWNYYYDYEIIIFSILSIYLFSLSQIQHYSKKTVFEKRM